MKTYLIAAVLILFISGFTFAQSTQALTLDECVQIALQNNYSLRVAELQMQTADQQIVSARSAWLPQINSSFSFGKYVQGRRTIRQDVPIGVDPVTGQYIYEQRDVVIGQTDRNSYSASVSFNQNLYDFGATANAIRQSKAVKSSYQHNLFNTRHLVIANVKDKYFQLLMALRLLGVYEEAVHHAEENLDFNQTMLDVGLKSKAEIYQARVNLGTQRGQFINQKNVIEFAKAQLNSSMGRTPETPIDVIESSDETLFPEYSFQQAVEIALQKNEALKAVEADINASEYAVRSAKAQYAPSIGARIGYYRDNDNLGRVYSNKLDEDYTATIGAGIDLNIFNGFSDKARVQREKINHEMAIERLKEQKRTLITDINQFFLEFKAYQDIIALNRENLSAYEENLRLQQEKRRIGSGTELEVMQAQVYVVQAQEALVSGEYNAKISQAYLQAALGIIDETK